MIPWPIGVILLLLSCRGLVAFLDDALSFRYGKKLTEEDSEMRIRIREAIRQGIEDAKRGVVKQ
jgi:hypothetical protein